MTTDEISQAVANIKAKKEAEDQREETNGERTKRLWRRASHLEWQYRNDFIRGKYVFVAGLPHVFKATAPRYFMSKAELAKSGLKPGQAKPVCHTYNEQAGFHYLYDVRDCTRIAGAGAASRLEKVIAGVQEEIKKGHRRGYEVTLQALQELRDISF